MRLNENILKPIDMPKLHSPFKRRDVNGAYVCVPEIDDDYKWVFTSRSQAIEKMDGTNVSIIVEGKNVTSIYNRKNLIDMWKKGNKRFTEGILESIDREDFLPGKVGDGQYFGELLGPRINGNLYQLTQNLWMPFSDMSKRLRFKFWDDFVCGLDGKSDEEIYEKVSDVFKGLWSLYKRKRRVTGDVNEKTGFVGLAAEGIVFYNKETKQMGKLRRDMFEWWSEKRH